MTQTWRLDSADQTLVLCATNAQFAQIIYWGAPLPMKEDLETLNLASEWDVTGGMLDEHPPLSICPEAARSFSGQAGMVIRNKDGSRISPRFQFEEASHDPSALLLKYRDEAAGLSYKAWFAINPKTQMIETRAALQSDQPIYLDWLAAPVFPAPQSGREIIDFSGRWCGEFQMNETPWSAGIRLRENHTGRSGHEHFPGLVLPNHGATNTTGEVYAFHYGWSGGHKMIVQELPDGRRQIQFGHASSLETEAACKFETATLYAMYSAHGINGCAVGFQRHLRDAVLEFPNPTAMRPVHYNCWEAVYFDHNLEELKDIATQAAALGAERFVLDDGWFAQRDDDTSSLGDWVVDTRKYPEGLTPLISHIRSCGMQFGLWFEPEMVNPNSDVYRAHPEWVLGPEDQILGRQQMVLDMACVAVQDYLFAAMNDILTAYEIDYIKWDHNRVLPVVNAAQTRGTYALIDRLRAAHPHVEIESCASGGGRIDYGILRRTHRVWLSDSNDALERVKIQHNAAIFLPMVVTGSHVGPRKCHTSGRSIDMSMRAWVAASRHMGFEMDPRELTNDEADVLREVTQWWKDNRHWMALADILRLDSDDKAVIGEQQLSQCRGQFVVFAAQIQASKQILPRPLRLTGLKADALYRIELVNRNEAHSLSRAEQALKSRVLTLSGAYLMSHGLTLPWRFPETMWVIKGDRL